MLNIEFVKKIVSAVYSSSGFATIRQISKKAGLSYNAAHRTVSALIKENVLSVQEIGHSKVVLLTHNSKTLSYLSLSLVEKDPIKASQKITELAKKWKN